MLYEANKRVSDAEDKTDWTETKHAKDMRQMGDEMKALKKKIEQTKQEIAKQKEENTKAMNYAKMELKRWLEKSVAANNEMIKLERQVEW